MFIRFRPYLAVHMAATALLAGCSLMSPPKDLDLRTTRPSLANAYQVSIRPIDDDIEINKIHSWEIQLAGAAGEPVRNARILVDGGMPQHGHGLPTKPRVTAELAAGRYRVDGVKFSMTGWWELKLDIDAGKGRDQVTFNLVLPQASGNAGMP